MEDEVEFNDYPLMDVVLQVQERLKVPGTEVYQKWTCAHCRSRQTMEEPNTFYMSGTCEECGQVSDIHECNYMLVLSSRKVN